MSDKIPWYETTTEKTNVKLDVKKAMEKFRNEPMRHDPPLCLVSTKTYEQMARGKIKCPYCNLSYEQHGAKP